MFWAAVILVLLAIVAVGVYLGLRYEIGVVKEEKASGRRKSTVTADRPVPQGHVAISRLETSRE